MPLGGRVTTVFTVGLNGPSAPVLPLLNANASVGAKASINATAGLSLKSERFMCALLSAIEFERSSRSPGRDEKCGTSPGPWAIPLPKIGFTFLLPFFRSWRDDVQGVGRR